ncbi:MAG: hypothetical protein HQM07_06065 [Zetaproteobacteria bacterium]|nr:hypothetical protein [Zetaproteobacteria bacterium]
MICVSVCAFISLLYLLNTGYDRFTVNQINQDTPATYTQAAIVLMIDELFGGAAIFNVVQQLKEVMHGCIKSQAAGKS